ncbi:MAG TPA: fatty acid desaturase [Vicinamibacterales bacterium]|nr:fatty acid desaturase [Vicinamibacterales bacterium]
MPERLNWFILTACILCTAACLWLASHAPWWAALPAAVAFAFVNHTPFSLLHEGVHGVGAATPGRNYVLGLIAGWMFPTSFSIQRTAHLGHHARNRTDLEIYDYYLPHESRCRRNLWMYGGNLMGLYWACIPLSNALYLLATPVYRSRFFADRIAPAMGFEHYVHDLVRLSPGKVWLEIGSAFAYQGVLWWALDLTWQGWLLSYWMFALHWSALQYADHAWSARDVTDGAWDLGVAAPVRWLALNYHYHKAHHRHPHAPWTQLPSLATRHGQPTFWQVYRSMWRHGVQPAPPMGAPANLSLLASAKYES